MVVIFLLLCLLILLLLTFMGDSKCDRYDEKGNPKPNINKEIKEAEQKINEKNSKYTLGPKRYEYDFIDNEQPINGLSPDYEQNYPSTLKKSNKMFVDQDLSVKYINLLNTKNNSLRTYNNS
jgi:hypothetical protein